MNAVGISSKSIPQPLSVMRIKSIPPPLTDTEISVAPASIAFSVNSLTIDDGLSTTSPAAIRLNISLGSLLIFIYSVFSFKSLNMSSAVRGVISFISSSFIMRIISS